ncbi:MAG: peptidylprolyl isomerase [Spirochaetes bacterium]|nr:peptidylprolyl isomerase [Spirochaetota bacterium]
MGYKDSKINKIFSWILAVIIIISFVGGSAFLYINRSHNQNVVATVNGEDIYLTRDSELYDNYQMYLKYYSQFFQDINEQMQMQLLQMALNEVIDNKIQLQFAKKFGINVSEVSILNKIKSENIFYDEKGEFVFNKYTESEKYKILKRVENYLLTQIMNKDIEFGSVLFSDLEAYNYFKLSEDTFKGKFVVFELEDFISEEELKKIYETSTDKYIEMEAAHILIKDEEKANQIYQTVIANPDKFETLAKEFSEDPGTKEKGGYLGVFDKYAMVKEFSDAAFSLKNAGDITKPVKTQYGFHIIKCIKPPYKQDFDKVKENIKKEYIQMQQNILLKKAYDKATEFTNKFINTQDFEKVAKESNKEIYESNEFNYKGHFSDKYSSRVDDEFFNTVLKLKEGQITGPIKITDGYIVFYLEKFNIKSKKDFEDKKAGNIKKFQELFKFLFNSDFLQNLKDRSKIKRYNIFNTKS